MRIGKNGRSSAHIRWVSLPPSALSARYQGVPLTHNYIIQRFSMMDTEPPQIIGRNCASSTLDTLIQSLDGAKITSGIPPAQVAFGITSTLLAMIRVRSLPINRYGSQIQVYSGFHGQQTRLRRAREVLCSCLSSSQPRVKREAIGPTHPVRARGDRPVDYVS